MGSSKIIRCNFICNVTIFFVQFRRESIFVILFVFNLGKPSSPKGPLEVTDVHKEGCKLSRIKPDDDGGLPIKEYEIEKLDTNTGKWTRVGKVNGERQPPTYNVTGLEPGKSYQFRVTAINDEGDSEPLISIQGALAVTDLRESRKSETYVSPKHYKIIGMTLEEAKQLAEDLVTGQNFEKHEANRLAWEEEGKRSARVLQEAQDFLDKLENNK